MYIFISFLILMGSYYLFKKASGSLDIRRLNMGSYVFYHLLAMTFIASIGILYHLEPEGYVPEDASLRLYGWMSVMYTMIMVPVGMLIACMILKVKSMKILLSQYQSSPLESQFTLSENSFKLTLYFFSGLSVLAVGYVVLSQEVIPLFVLMSGSDDYMQLAWLRGSSGLRMEGHEFLRAFILLFAGFSSVMAFTSYAYWKKEKRFRPLVWFICMTLAAGFLITYDLVKGRILYFLIGLILTHIMISGKIKTKKAFILAMVFVFLMGVLTIFVQGVLQGTGKSANLLTILTVGVEALWGRAVFGQLMCSYMCFDIFPDLHPHLWFSTTGRFIHKVLGLTYRPDYGIIVMSFFRPAMVEAGIAGHATTVFIGEAWANFGLLGILLGPLWVGFFIQLFYIFFLKLKKTPFNLALYVQFTILMPILSGVKGFYYPVWILQYLMLIFILLFVASILKSFPKKSFRVAKHVRNVTI